MYANVNAGVPGKYTYVADLTRPAATAGSWRIANLRMTIQATTQNKFNLFWDEQHPCQGATWGENEEGCRHQEPGQIIGGAPGQAGTFGTATATSAPEIASYAGPRADVARVPARPAGDVELAADEQAVPRGRGRRIVQPVRRAAGAGQPDAGTFPASSNSARLDARTTAASRT